ncbi:MAG: methionyl-tRNA formyltransferase [Clostridia bacterium]|nr:methionyl-tRNA formyltransferase [Clostridia bacterium]
MRIVFMGTPDFAVSALRVLAEDRRNVVCVLTQPDKPKGRGYALCPSPVRAYAESVGFRVETPVTLRSEESLELLKELQPDLILVAAYGKILPKAVLDLPTLGCVNLHASLLPAWRGAAPIQRAVMNGDTEGGITVMQMDEGLDTGNIILQKQTPIGPDMTAGEYHDVLAGLAAEALREFLRIADESAGPVSSVPQPEGATYAAKIEKEEGRIAFLDSAEDTHNRIRGLSPFPGAFTFLNGKRVKLLESRLSGRTSDAEPGTILSAGRDGLEVACRTGSVFVTQLQPEGKGPMSGANFANGIHFHDGSAEPLRFHG